MDAFRGLDPGSILSVRGILSSRVDHTGEVMPEVFVEKVRSSKRGCLMMSVPGSHGSIDLSPTSKSYTD